jgi:hypothetical protein
MGAAATIDRYEGDLLAGKPNGYGLYGRPRWFSRPEHGTSVSYFK